MHLFEPIKPVILSALYKLRAKLLTVEIAPLSLSLLFDFLPHPEVPH